MKQILIIITNFQHGGTNKSLQNLLSLIDAKKYKVDVFTMAHSGPYSNLLPNCIILPKNKWLHALIVDYRNTSGAEKRLSLILKVLRKFLSFIKYNFADFLYRKTVAQISRRKAYDSVVAFSEGAPTAFVRYFNTPNKIAWIRCDYSSYMELNNHPNEKAIYESYKSIVCVSEYTQKKFVQIYPEFSFKTCAIHNILDTNSFIGLSQVKELDSNFRNDVFTIVSIGRFYRTKRFSSIPDIAEKLIGFGCKFKWYVIGGAGDKEEKIVFNQKMEDYRLTNILFALGEKDNPYPYIRNSDLMVSTSATEACPNVINEAKVLHVPIVSSDFGSVFEFIEDNVNGMIAPINQIAEKIALLINNKITYKRIKDEISNFEYNNEDLLSKVESIL